MRKVPAIALAVAVAGCTPPTPPRISPPQSAPPLVTPPPAIIVERRDRPVTPGTWTYVPASEGSSATFGRPGAAPDLTIACRPAAHQIALTRAGGQGGTLTVTTSSGPASWPAGVEAGGTTVLIAARDPFLDKLAFSRGRFTVEVPGLAELVIPAWAEPARVVEDCRD